MSVLVERSFVVPVAVEAAWQLLADVEDWPAWAPHIRSVELEPPGGLGPTSRGRFRLRGAPASSFSMLTYDPPRHWSWAGSVAGMRVTYDHRFGSEGPSATRITFVVEGHGPISRLVGRPFAWIYGRNLDRAIPRLIDRYRRVASGST